METCGYICVSKDRTQFFMRCSYCPIDVKIAQWKKFVVHFRTTHQFDLEENSDQPEHNFNKDTQCLDNNTPTQDILNDASVEKQAIGEFQLEMETDKAGSHADQGAYERCSTDGKENNIQSKPFIFESQFETEIGLIDSLAASSISDHSSYGNDLVECDLQTQPDDNNDISVESVHEFKPSFFVRNAHMNKFIELYKSYPCLWSPEHTKYKEPEACTLAYQKLINDLDAGIGATYTHKSLKAAIKKLHTQYETVNTRVSKGTQKSNSVAFSYYSSCEFLKACIGLSCNSKKEKIQLDFATENKLTAEFIKHYSQFPQLYDHKHKEFSSAESRKQAYETMASEISIPHTDINSDDIFLAIQNLRQWYYKTSKNATSDFEKSCLKSCRFLPPKMFKQKLTCEICHKEIFSDHVLRLHLYEVHNIGELPFKCPQCDRGFKNRSDMTAHLQRVHIGKTHKCSYCDRTFAVISDLRPHLRTHTGIKPFVCDQCGKAFRVRSQLTLHVRAIHTKVRAFKCTMCPKDFLKNVHLRDHMKSHMGIRDKICDTCGKGFTNCHSLIRHRQIHAEVKKFACKLCDSRFSQFVGLNSHMKRTHSVVKKNTQVTEYISN